MLKDVAIVAILGSAMLAMPAYAEDKGVRDTAERAASEHAIPDLHAMLMDKLDDMNARKEGIFHHDITPSLQSYFPVGQPMAETKKIIAMQKLGTLKPFKGTNDAGMGKMFVTKFDLTGHVFSNVYVVLDFDFDGAEPQSKLTHMQAFLRASNM